MKTQDKVRFVRNLTKAVADDLIAKIKTGKVPDEWDGHELRWLLAEKFNRESTLGRVGLYHKRDRRYRDYCNAVIVENL